MEAIVFDLDGTLLDTLDDLTDAVNVALAEAFDGAKARTLDRATVRRFVGNGVPKLIERALGAFGVTDATVRAAALKAFTAHYNAHGADKTAPYPGVIDMIAELKRCGIKTAVVTNKYEAAAKTLVAKLLPGIDVVIGASDGRGIKPAPDGVYAALDALGAEKADAVYVGDGETDIATANNSGLPVIAVSWGFRDKAVLKALDPDIIIDAPSEIFSALGGIKRSRP